MWYKFYNEILSIWVPTGDANIQSAGALFGKNIQSYEVSGIRTGDSLYKQIVTDSLTNYPRTTSCKLLPLNLKLAEGRFTFYYIHIIPKNVWLRVRQFTLHSILVCYFQKEIFPVPNRDREYNLIVYSYTVLYFLLKLLKSKLMQHNTKIKFSILKEMNKKNQIIFLLVF